MECFELYAILGEITDFQGKGDLPFFWKTLAGQPNAGSECLRAQVLSLGLGNRGGELGALGGVQEHSNPVSPTNAMAATAASDFELKSLGMRQQIELRLAKIHLDGGLFWSRGELKANRARVGLRHALVMIATLS